jgi:hypothetical protein
MKVDVRALLQTHIDRLASEYTYVDFDMLRQSYMSTADPDLDEYRTQVEAIAVKIRVQAFDSMVTELAAKIGSENPDVLLPILRHAGIHILDHDVHVIDWPLSLKPTVFHEDAFNLFP